MLAQYSIEPGKEVISFIRIALSNLCVFSRTILFATQYILIVNRTRDLPDYKETTSNVPPDTTDSDGIPDMTNPGIVTITLTSPPYDQTSRNNDFGFLPVVRIGDKVS